MDIIGSVMMSDELLRAILAHNQNLCFGGRELDQAELDLIKECRWDEPVRQSVMVEADGTCNFNLVCTADQGATILEGDSYVFPQRLGPRTMIREVIPPCQEYPTGGAFYHETQPTIFRGKISIYHHAAELIKARDEGLEAAAALTFEPTVAAALRAMKGQVK